MRHDGYYWVKMGIFWEIAHWNGAAEHWTIHGEDGRFSDGCWSGINERRIERGEFENSELRLQCGGMEMEIGELRQQRDELVAALTEVTATLAWLAHGECRAIHDGPIMPSAMAVETGKAAIAKTAQAGEDK